uniref:Tyrosine-protein phosphatase domain-containing protein n=1 Tax=Ascaris lumbricoides TaxID=6252 RepID=A0A0M3HY17_ASCLU
MTENGPTSVQEFWSYLNPTFSLIIAASKPLALVPGRWNEWDGAQILDEKLRFYKCRVKAYPLAPHRHTRRAYPFTVVQRKKPFNQTSKSTERKGQAQAIGLNGRAGRGPSAHLVSLS